MSIFSKSKPTTSSAFSEFIRNGSAAEKKKVYTEVMRKATERQNAVLAESGRAPACSTSEAGTRK